MLRPLATLILDKDPLLNLNNPTNLSSLSSANPMQIPNKHK